MVDVSAVAKQLQDDEGFRGSVYKDTTGNETIGYGHKVLYGEDWSDGITREQAYDLLITDIHRTVKNMNILFPWWGNLSENIQDALANLAYNLGVAGLLTFHQFLDLLRKGEYLKASQDLTTTLWHKQVGNRAVRIEAIFAAGEDKDDADAVS